MAVAPGRLTIWTTYMHTVSPTEAAEKKFILRSQPKVASTLMVDVLDGGGTVISGTHFSLVGSEIHWSGFELDGTLAQGDRLRITYA